MKRYAIGVSLLIALSSCAAQRLAEAKAELDQQEATCRAEYPSASKGEVRRPRCVRDAWATYLSKAGAPGDLASEYLASMDMLIAKVDSGQISKEEASLKLSQVRHSLSDAQRARNMEDAAEFRANMQMFRPAAQTSCTRFGNTVNCSSY